MKTLRALAVAGIALLITACASTPSAPPMPKASAGPDVTGTWLITIETPMGNRNSDAIFAQSGEAVTGKMVSPEGEAPFTGTLKGDELAFGMAIEVQGNALQLDYTGKVTGDTIAGNVKFGDFGEGKWTAKKK